MSGKCVVVAGAGGNIGSHLCAHLARDESVGRLVLIDRDVYEARNSANQDILPSDAGHPKVAVQARRMQAIRADLEIVAIHSPLEWAPAGVWNSDLIVACLDSRIARQTVNERAWRHGVPWVDSGVLASEWLARVNVYVPSSESPCLECAWSDEDYARLEQQYPCAGPLQEPAPTGAPSALGALAASLAALECRKLLRGDVEHAACGRQVTLSALWHSASVTTFRHNPRCRFDHAQWRVQPLECDLQSTRVADMVDSGPISVPGQRFVRRLVCRCGGERKLLYLECSLSADQRACPRCGEPMAASGFDVIEELTSALDSSVAAQSLVDLGLRYGDVVRLGNSTCVLAEPD